MSNLKKLRLHEHNFSARWANRGWRNGLFRTRRPSWTGKTWVKKIRKGFHCCRAIIKADYTEERRGGGENDFADGLREESII